MKTLDYCLSLVLLSSLQTLSNADGYLEIKFISYVNRFGHDRNKHFCDSHIDGSKTTKCDFIFTIKLNGQNGGIGPRWEPIKSVTFFDKDSVYFPSYIGSDLTNPFKLKFSSWHGILNMVVDVVDKDTFTPDDHVDSFSTSLLVTPDNRRHQHRIVSHIHGHNSALYFWVKVACNSNFLSPACTERCTEDSGQNVCGVASSEHQCSSVFCNQQDKITVIVIPLILVLLVIGIIVITFRKRRKLRQLLRYKISYRIPQQDVRFENNLYQDSPQDDFGQSSDQEFDNKLYGTQADNPPRHSDDQLSSASVYDSLESIKEDSSENSEDEKMTSPDIKERTIEVNAKSVN